MGPYARETLRQLPRVHVLTQHCLQHIVYLSCLYFIICIFRSAMKRVAADMDALDNKKARDKFGNQFVYQISNRWEVVIIWQLDLIISYRLYILMGAGPLWQLLIVWYLNLLLPMQSVPITTKADCHDITEILLKVTLNTINQTNLLMGVVMIVYKLD